MQMAYYLIKNVVVDRMKAFRPFGINSSSLNMHQYRPQTSTCDNFEIIRAFFRQTTDFPTLSTGVVDICIQIVGHFDSKCLTFVG